MPDIFDQITTPGGDIFDTFPSAADWPRVNVTEGLPATTRLKMGFSPNLETTRNLLMQQYGPGTQVEIPQEGPYAGKMMVMIPGEKIPRLVNESGFSLGDVAQAAPGAPEAVLSGAGAIIGGAVAGGPGEIIGAGTGGAAGEALRQLVGEAYGVPQGPTGSRWANIGKAAAINAAGGAVGRYAINPMLQKALAPGGTNPVTRRAIREAKEAGIRLTPSEVSQGKSASLVESGLSNLLGSAGVMQRAKLKTLRRIGALRDALLWDLGGPIEALAAGESAGVGLASNRTIFKNVSAQLFSDVERQSAGLSVEMPKFIQTLDGILSDKVIQKTAPATYQKAASLKKLVYSPPKPVLGANGQPLLDAMGNPIVQPGGPRPLSFKEARDIRSAIGKLSQSPEVIADKREGLFKHLFTKFEEDLDDWAQGAGGPVLDAYKTAAAWYRMGVDPVSGEIVNPGKRGFSSPLAKKIWRIAQEDPGSMPSRLASDIFRPKNIDQIMEAKKLVGPTAFEDLKRRWFQEQLDKAGIELTDTHGLIFTTVSAQKFETLLNRFGRDQMERIFEPSQIENIDKFMRVIQRSSTAQRLATTNPSGTAQNINAMELIQAFGRKLGTGLLIGAGTATGKWQGGIAGAAIGGAGALTFPWLLAHAIVGPVSRLYGTSVIVPGGLKRAITAATAAGAGPIIRSFEQE